MTEEEFDFDLDDETADHHEVQSVWDLLTPKQKRYFKKLNEKNEENLRYIG